MPFTPQSTNTCGAGESGYAAYIPETNQFYWTCYAA